MALQRRRGEIAEGVEVGALAHAAAWPWELGRELVGEAALAMDSMKDNEALVVLDVVAEAYAVGVEGERGETCAGEVRVFVVLDHLVGKEEVGAVGPSGLRAHHRLIAVKLGEDVLQRRENSLRQGLFNAKLDVAARGQPPQWLIRPELIAGRDRPRVEGCCVLAHSRPGPYRSSGAEKSWWPTYIT